MAENLEFVAEGGVFLDGGGEDGADDGFGVFPGGVEAGVDGAVFAAGGGGGRRGGRGGVGDVSLLGCGKVDYGVGDAVGSAEGEDDAFGGGFMREGNVAGGVGEEGAGVPGLAVVLVRMLRLRRHKRKARKQARVNQEASTRFLT